MKETVAEGWAAYEKDIQPTEAERERLREAFYSGAFAGHVLTLAACITDDEATCEAQLFAIAEELQPFDKRKA
jgi:hypothetical protein